MTSDLAIPTAAQAAAIDRRDEAEALDQRCALAFTRARFRLPDKLIYLDGNSLGALPMAAPDRLAGVIGGEWGTDLIQSWNTAGWIDAPARVGAAIAPLVGVGADEVTVADSVSVNLFKLLAACLHLRPGRRVILTEPGNFPTDLYVAQGLAALVPGVEVRAVPADGLASVLGPEVAVLMLTHVHYKWASIHDMAGLTAAAHAAGALTLWDLSHSAGAVEVDLAAAGADFAVGCGYKYLNGGPGAPAFLFAARRHHERIAQPLSGWMGHAAPFDFVDEYAPAPGMGRFLCGTPPILSLSALEAGLATFAGIAMADVAAKSRALSALLQARMAARAPQLALASPADPAARGSHLVFRHPDAFAICQASIARGVVGDFRAPDLWRLGLTPLYTRYVDVWDAAEVAGDIIARGAWRDPAFARRAAVT
jgi:kynureninase